ncbi:MAG: DUF1996 domain-containing protein [Acidimicrobiia bacterium]|nr:DUF1996 domain-containing protein [Acidimicrobiia bacterium]
MRTRLRGLLLILAFAAVGVLFGTAEASAEPGAFRVECGKPIKFGHFDPIVYPGENNVGHHHSFFGSRAISPDSTIKQLQGSTTECEDSADTSSYWIPTVYIEGRRADPVTTFYYTARNDDKSLVGMEEWPLGLRIVAGDMMKDWPSTEPVYWGCSNDSNQPKEGDVPTCTDGHLQAHVIFPDCWDGFRLDSPNHQSHMTYSDRDGNGDYTCPSSHPVNLPFLIARFAWPGQTPAASAVEIASGPTTGFHADFINAWEPRRLAFLTQHCIVEGNDCETVDDNDPRTPSDFEAPDRDNPPPDDEPPGDEPPNHDLSFTDTSDTVFAQDIEKIAAEGITRGCNPPDNTRYCPDDNVTRGEMAAFLTRALHLHDTDGPNFTDISDTVFSEDIQRIAAEGITRGCNPPDNTRYCPDDNVTRGEMAAFLTRALNLPDAHHHHPFTDISDTVFSEDIERIAAEGITRGCNPPDNTRYCPNDNVTRGEMAAFLARALGL